MVCVDHKSSVSREASPRKTLRQSGSGYGGTWTPVDDFVARRRKTSWSPSKAAPQAPPRVYLDNKTLIREVTDLTSLRHGDHCLTSLNPVRIISPTLDNVISWLGHLEFTYLWHHLLVCDDVDHLDEQGVPRTQDGKLVQIVEFSNTPTEALTEVRSLCGGNLLRFPGSLVRFMFDKAACHQAALADYGDTPHIYRIVEQQSVAERDRITKEAISLTTNYRPYNILFNNCEHAANSIHTGEKRSHNFEYMMWLMLRVCLCCVGLVFLNAIAAVCYNTFCMSYPLWTLIAYHCFTSVPVGLQAIITYTILCKHVWQQYCKELIDRDDCYHLLAKELGRVLVVGGLTILVIALMPKMIQDTQHFICACFLCLFAYPSSDLLYNALAQIVMRLVLLPLFGRVWLIGNGKSLKQE